MSVAALLVLAGSATGTQLRASVEEALLVGGTCPLMLLGSDFSECMPCGDKVRFCPEGGSRLCTQCQRGCVCKGWTSPDGRKCFSDKECTKKATAAPTSIW